MDYTAVPPLLREGELFFMNPERAEATGIPRFTEISSILSPYPCWQADPEIFQFGNHWKPFLKLARQALDSADAVIHAKVPNHGRQGRERVTVICAAQHKLFLEIGSGGSDQSGVDGEISRESCPDVFCAAKILVSSFCAALLGSLDV